MPQPRSPFVVLIWAIGLVTLGFAVGYGFQNRTPTTPAEPASTPQATPQAPLVKGLRAAPDGSWVAFTGIYNQSSQAGVFLVSPRNGQWTFTQSPTGWQDYVAQWRSNSRAVVLEREKIPRPVAEGHAGIYQIPVDQTNGHTGELRDITPELPRGEKILSSLLGPDGQLYLRTKREPKSLLKVVNGVAVPLDRAEGTLSQNRPIREMGKTIFLNVRDAVGSDGAIALYRVENGHAKAISPAWKDVSWSYVAPSGKFMLLAREDGSNWQWSLYRIGPTSVTLVKTAPIPGDVIVVYWSPDEKTILGAAGEKLWTIGVPTLHAKPVGNRSDWNADDATWLDSGKTAIIAASGELWRIDTQTGESTRFWRFPPEFWKESAS